MPARGRTHRSDAVGIQAEGSRILSHPANARLSIVDLRRPRVRRSQAVVDGDADIAQRSVVLSPTGEVALIPGGPTSTMHEHNSRLRIGRDWRKVEVQLLRRAIGRWRD